MRVQRWVALVVVVVCVAAGIGARAEAAADDVPAGYERVDVKSAALSILVPEGMKTRKAAGEVLFFAFDGSRVVEHAVSVMRSNRYASLPSRADLRSNAARLRGVGAEVQLQRASVADLPAVQQTVTLGKTKSTLFFLEPKPGHVVFVSYMWPTAESDYAGTVDTLIDGVRVLRT